MFGHVMIKIGEQIPSQSLERNNVSKKDLIFDYMFSNLQRLSRKDEGIIV